MASRSRLLVFLLVMACADFAGCGSFFVGFVSNPGGTVIVSGVVIVVSIGVTEQGSPTTAVTFLNAANNNVTITFCGDQRFRFPINQSVQAALTSGSICSTLISSVIIQTG